MKFCKEHTFAVCAYKESPYLEACIRSLLNQTVKSNILIATSTPNEMIRKIAEKYMIPYHINTGEAGITQDWNFAYRCAESRYITIAHQDDIYDAGYLETALYHMKRSKKPLIFFCDYYEIRDGKKVTGNRLLNVKRIMLLPLRIKMLQKSKLMRRRILSLGSPVCCPSVLFAAEHLPEAVFVHGFRACEDWEAWERISRIDGEFIYSSKMLMGHRIHEESETSAIIGDNQRSKEEYQMYCKFWPKWIARILTRAYASSQDSNRLDKNKG